MARLVYLYMYKPLVIYSNTNSMTFWVTRVKNVRYLNFAFPGH